jgi:hypothetical protein
VVAEMDTTKAVPKEPLDMPTPDIENAYIENAMVIVWPALDFVSCLSHDKFPRILGKLKKVYGCLEAHQNLRQQRSKRPNGDRFCGGTSSSASSSTPATSLGSTGSSSDVTTNGSFVGSNEPLVMIVLEGVDGHILNAQQSDFASHRSGNASGAPRRATSATRGAQGRLNDTLSWLYLTMGCHVRLSRDTEQTVTMVVDLVKSLAIKPYIKPSSLLDVVTRHKKTEAQGGTQLERDRWRLKETWRNQLACLPRMSVGKANALVKHYPTPQSLLQTYNDPTKDTAQKQALLAHVFGNANRAELKLSTVVHLAMTCTNPNYKFDGGE